MSQGAKAPQPQSGPPDTQALHDYLAGLQARICTALEAEDGKAHFSEQRLEGPGASLAVPRVLEGGALFEKAAVNFTHSFGKALPPAAGTRHPELAGAPFEAVSLSLIVHPQNPYVPTVHLNLRGFSVRPEGAAARWWLGGGFDLTPCYGFEEDCVHWHQVAREACTALGPDAYPRFKKQCDEYFFLPHRGEARGIGGIFFDDLEAPGWAPCFAFWKSVGEHFLPGYLPIVQRRRGMAYGARERDFQFRRRGRYAEFNLAWDRGTRYGLQSGRRIESVLASLPPRVHWPYQGGDPEADGPEAELVEKFLTPRDWAAAKPAPGRGRTG